MKKFFQKSLLYIVGYGGLATAGFLAGMGIAQIEEWIDEAD